MSSVSPLRALEGLCLDLRDQEAAMVGGPHHGFGCQCHLPAEHDGDHVCNAESVNWPSGCGETWPSEVIEAEVVEAECPQCGIGQTTPHSQHPERRGLNFSINGIAETAVVVDAELAPTGGESWWRLGPNIRDRYHTATDYGVADVEATSGGVQITMTDGFQLMVPVLDWRAHWGFENSCGPEYGPPHGGEVVYLDVLRDGYPTTIPGDCSRAGPQQWQQMSRRGDLTYPGPDMRNWTYDSPWDSDPNFGIPTVVTVGGKQRPVMFVNGQQRDAWKELH